MKYDFSISIVHVSDLHWTAEEILHRTALDKIPLADVQQEFLRSLHTSAVECSSNSNETILVLGGDNVFQSNYDKRLSSYKPKVVSALVEEIFKPILNFKGINDSIIFRHVIAVPGNHDIDSPLMSSDPADSFIEFKKLIGLLQQVSPSSTEFHLPDSSSHTFRIRSQHGSILFWAINSSAQCGVGDSAEQKLAGLLTKIRSEVGKYKDVENYQPLNDAIERLANSSNLGKVEHYPGYVYPGSMIECEKELYKDKDYLRIAILHHNNLLTAKDDTQKYRFLNPSKFNRFLLEHKFRLVLHGHQHTGEVAAYNVFPKTDAEYSSYLTDGFLTIGSPSFDLGDYQTENGFNIIRLEFSRSSQICRVEVTKHVWNDYKIKQVKRSYDIALAPFDKSRSDLQRDLNRLVYSEQSDRGLIRAIDSLTQPQKYPDFVREEFRGLQNVRAIYALSVFQPTNWLHGKLVEMFYVYGNKNIITAAQQYAKFVINSRSHGLYFIFSKPLVYGIETAMNNRLNLTDELTDHAREYFRALNYTQAIDFLHRLTTPNLDISNRAGKFSHASVVDEAREIDGSQSNVPLLIIAPGAQRPFHNFSGQYNENTKQNVQLNEFPRIVLWTEEELQSD